MTRTRIYISRFTLLLLLLLRSASCPAQSVSDVMDGVIARFYQNLDMSALKELDDGAILALLTEKEREILATKYWTFNTNAPVVVSLMRHIEQRTLPFWLPSSGFVLTNFVVRNEEYSYEVWQKRFAAGPVGLGINGFDKHRPHYFLCVAPENSADVIELSQFSPEPQHQSQMREGAFTYHDWDELVLTEVPEALRGQILLTTIRGRAREAHLINAFRRTAHPASQNPDQLLLSWDDDPRTTQVIQWRTGSSVSDGAVRYWIENDTGRAQQPRTIRASRVPMRDRLLSNDRVVHRFTAKLVDLQPGTKYSYVAGSPEKDVWSPRAEFITAPEGERPFKFIYFGDTHKSPHWGELINTAYKRHPEAAFYTIAGDMVSIGLHRDEWDELFVYSAGVIRNRPLMPSLGNHDDQDGLGAWMYFDLFELPRNGPDSLEPERCYSFEYGNALFLMLDATSPVQAQTAWLAGQLESTEAVWKFAVFHFPPYSYEEDYPKIREQWGALFDQYHVDMVLTGHVHYYMRSKPMFAGQPAALPALGTIYVISIAVPNREEEMPPREYVEVRFGGEMLYQTFEIDGGRLLYRAWNLAGEIRDELVIEK